MKASTTGIGVIGTGFGRLVHMPGFKAVKGATLVGVASKNAERAQQVAEQFGLPMRFPTWEALVACPEIQAISVTTPPDQHEPIVLAIVAAGKAVLCEKPLTMNSAQAKRVLDAARDAHIVHMVDFEFREIPAWRLAKQLLSSGRLGRLRHVTVNWVVQSWADPRRAWSWRADSKQGGGLLGSHVVHVFDYLEWLVAPIRSVAAHLRTCVNARPSPDGRLLPVDVEDYCQLLLELIDGTPVSATVSNVAPFATGHRLEFQGETGTLLLASQETADYVKGFEVLLESGGELVRQPIPEELHLGGQFTDGRIGAFFGVAQRFVDAVAKSDLDVRPSFADGFRAQCLMEAARRSFAERQWVEIPPSSVLGAGEKNGSRSTP